MSTPPPRGRLRSALSRLTADRDELAASEESALAAAFGGTPCSDLYDRVRTRVCGVLRTVTLRPRGGVPALEAELFDGSGTLTVIWLGRREIAGIEPGRRIVVTGLVSCSHGRSVMYNPAYELLPVDGS
ncbi:OB-fold nucleic acid binding domain-containing protein [Quadrisphaera sp. GCM10027208]|uniref:OB-fold nucleic acid binding domain-containing protein n=1 Tax=Quadrisphaera sp. GCM10027208 TaxID=3273423 RepID=UPI003623DCF6